MGNAQGMTQGLSKRERDLSVFTADQKAVSYLHAAQFLAPNFAPTTDAPPQETGGEVSRTQQPRRRGGDLRHAPWPHAPWPCDRRLRLKAISRIAKELERKGYLGIAAPWKDRPKWIYVTMAGIRRLGLDYHDAHFPHDEEELDHLYQITRVRLLIGRRPEHPQAAWFTHTWISERQLKASYPQNEPGVTLPHLPDGALELDEDAEVKMAGGEKLPFGRGGSLGGRG
jgi:hypothetical protein